MQKVMGNAMAACTLLNVGKVLSVSALEVAASASFIAAGFFGIANLVNFLKVCSSGMQICHLSFNLFSEYGSFWGSYVDA